MYKPIKSYKRKIEPVLLTISSGIITIAFSALFISGALMNTFLKILPLFIHQIIGWGILAVWLISILLSFK